ncbi:MAG: ATP synthase F1 subunit delta [Betaproteobacteria bacterium RIFCSPLOWO2_12_FULL_66_14]|nr:MAG: ATP synthase F1 subunit delta [Betaproteobacteria bacterium RIFCSPLOWO2_12_FULL_66_14]
MAEIATIARPYAEAAFELADASGTLEAWSRALAGLAEAVSQPDMQQLLGNPLVSDTALVQMLLAVVEQSAGEATAETRNFLLALAENKRLAVLPAVREQFEALKNERQGAVDALIESAFALDQGELATLVADLERRFRRKVRPEVRVDAELIGGARITIGDQVIDGSVRGKLAALAAGLVES